MEQGHGRSTALAVLALVWLGLLLGVSFLATPVKFMAPSLSLPVALDVGRQTFTVFNKVEIVLVLALLALTVGRRGWRLVCACGMAVLIAVQSVWLLPVLDRRLGMILTGETPPPSHLHTVYIALELTKLLLLIAVAMFAFREVVRRS